MRRVLIVAYFFPPLGGMGSARVAGFARYLAEYGWEPTVLTPREGAYHRDAGVTLPAAEVVRTSSLELSRIAKRSLRIGGDDVQPAQLGHLGSGLRRLARELVYYPDSQVGWYLPALISARPVVRARKFDAVFSSAYPITAHLIARRLRRQLDVPWVAEFRDPWTDRLPARSLARRRAGRLERALAREATSVVMTSPSWAQRYGERWGRPIEVITNGYETVTDAADAAPAEFTLSYLGSFYPDRQDLTAVWKAVSAAAADGNAGVQRIRLIGEGYPVLEEQLRSYGLESLVEVTGYLPNREATSRLRSSTAAVLAGPKDGREDLRGEIAGKTFDYLASELPIIYVGRPDCDAADLLRRYEGCYVLSVDDVDGVARALRQVAGQRFERDVARFTRRALTGELARVLTEACG